MESAVNRAVQPPEWAPHRACLTAWPDSEAAWGEQLSTAQSQFEQFLRQLCTYGREPIWLMCGAASPARQRLADRAGPEGLVFVDVPYGDVWLRDIAPVFLDGAPHVATFGFNGWGGKYIYPNDAQVAGALCKRWALPFDPLPLVAEGGALESDGEGTYLTTESCLVNPNRNPGLDKSQVESTLGRGMGARKVIWLDGGLQNDHTDGHIDNVARFVGPAQVVCMAPNGADDPNRELLLRVAQTLAESTDAKGRRLRVQTIPSPGRVVDGQGVVLPASYMNFYVANAAVVMPAYGVPSDQVAAVALGRLFPGRTVLPLPSQAILTGGGSFHCVTQQIPLHAPLAMPTEDSGAGVDP